MEEHKPGEMVGMAGGGLSDLVAGGLAGVRSHALDDL